MKKLWIIFAMLIASRSAQAFTLFPLPIIEDKGKKYVEFSITEDDNKYKAVVKLWVGTDDTGQPILKDTRDLVATPAVFVAPKKLRIGILKKMSRDIEHCYRLEIDRIIDPAIQKVWLKPHLSIPIFIKPNKEIVDFKVSYLDGKVVMVNNGNVHVQVQRVGAEWGKWYVLPGQTYSHKIERVKPGTMEKIDPSKKDVPENLQKVEDVVKTDQGDYRY
ncbi:fimbria/pilus periplasmic chaperone [Geotalea sp. SG265]|uniref:fimbria/pilus periplasmic chaperone n=1 Tax=Geotalea sp. SG265 TaxID=2922867 RepID=UPI001FAFF11E|nr:fimbria/pilus periplasmic chaperone [Geotalea sp. SG265]